MLSQPPNTLDLPHEKRIFDTRDGRLVFEAVQGGTLVNGQFNPGFAIDEIVGRYQTIWAANSIEVEEVPIDCQLYINAEPIGPKTTIDDAVAWFQILRAALARFGQTTVAVYRDGQENPVLMTAQATHARRKNQPITP